jgi:thiol-disulfide isomerase/thioredoxin
MKLLPLFLLLFCGVLQAEPVPPVPAPAWKLKDVNGNVVSSDQFKGKVVVVDFWATWCGPCRSEIPGYERLQAKYAKDGLVIVGMATNDVGPDGVKKFMEEHGMNYQVVIGEDDVAAAFGGAGGIDGIPTTFIINRDGLIVDRKIGALETSEYEKLLLNVLKPAAAKSQP